VAAAPLEPSPFAVDSGGVELAGESIGEGQPIVLAHGITATRRYVVHGSKALPRRGYELVSYDARGHGESGPAPDPGAYGYPELTADLDRVISERTTGTPPLAGHSMGCHTIASFALQQPERVAGAVLIGPVTIGLPPPEEVLAHWARLADGLERDGAEGFMDAYEADLDVGPEWRETVLRITRERIELHRNPRALADALRVLPRSLPFDGLTELESLAVPALVVASRDEADPGHPYAVAEAWAERIPGARLIVEEPGESPLAWQGGKLSRAIAEFCEEPAVAERLGPSQGPPAP
jgi:pimeloyl-ACP methyl ester carboxylesterase